MRVEFGGFGYFLPCMCKKYRSIRGTIAMCLEVERLYKESDLKEKRIIVMAGHQDGIISFGKNLQEALKILEQHELSL